MGVIGPAVLDGPGIRMPFRMPAQFPIPGAEPATNPTQFGQFNTETVQTWNQINARRKVIDHEARGRSLIRLWDKQMKFIGKVVTHKDLDVEQLLHDTGTGAVTLRGSDWLVKFLRTDLRAAEDLNLTIDPYPNRRNWRWRLGFKVTNVKVAKAEDGALTVKCEVAENREHWKHILLGATVFAPPEAQPIKAFLLPANCRTAVTIAGTANLARLFNPALAVIGNLLNPGAWIGAANPLNLNPLNWPIQMQFCNPIFDQSRLTVLMSRWQDAHSVTEQMLRDAGCNVRVYTWLTEDEDSPHPELAAIIGEKAARPTRNCYIIAAEDNSGVTGVTGTAIDGAINLIAATGDDLITNTLIPEFDENGDGVTDPLIRKWFGAAPAVPSLLFRDGERSAIITSEHNMYKGKAKHLMTGGRSPQWVCPPRATGGDGPTRHDSTKCKRSSSATRSARLPKRSRPYPVRRRSFQVQKASKTCTRVRQMTCSSRSCATPIPTANCPPVNTDCSKSSFRDRARLTSSVRL